MIKTILEFVLITLSSDFQHCLGVCLRSVETDEVSKLTAVLLVSDNHVL